jgi:hypothetical protein
MPPSKCYYRGCSNNRKNRPDLSYHKFPIKNPTLCQKWLENAAVDDVLYEEFNCEKMISRLGGKSICSIHFDKKYFNTVCHSRSKLLGMAVPNFYIEIEAEERINSVHNLREGHNIYNLCDNSRIGEAATESEDNNHVNNVCEGNSLVPPSQATIPLIESRPLFENEEDTPRKI